MSWFGRKNPLSSVVSNNPVYDAKLPTSFVNPMVNPNRQVNNPVNQVIAESNTRATQLTSIANDIYRVIPPMNYNEIGDFIKASYTTELETFTEEEVDIIIKKVQQFLGSRQTAGRRRNRRSRLRRSRLRRSRQSRHSRRSRRRQSRQRRS